MKNYPSGFLFLIALTTTVLVLGCTNSSEATASLPGAPSNAGNVSDVDVNEHVKTTLHQSESLKTFDIGVTTLNGDVKLVGTLDNQTQIDEALRIARSADGVHSIHDELVIKQ
jgi:osmotically-inducible protein OsmY